MPRNNKINKIKIVATTPTFHVECRGGYIRNIYAIYTIRRTVNTKPKNCVENIVGNTLDIANTTSKTNLRLKFVEKCRLII